LNQPASAFPAACCRELQSKEAMVMELFDVIMDQYFAFLREAIKSRPKGPQRLKALIKTMFGLNESRELLTEKSFYAFYYLSLFDDQIKSRFNRKSRQLIEFVTTEIESIAKFKGANQVDATKQAKLLLSLFEGFSFF
jgi:AcrR family transcriptional regulator